MIGHACPLVCKDLSGVINDLQRGKYCDQITALKKVLGLLPAMFP